MYGIGGNMTEERLTTRVACRKEQSASMVMNVIVKERDFLFLNRSYR